MDWQRKATRDIFGWKRPDGTRRYRTVYIEIPKGNGKSPWAAALALAVLCLSDEQAAEIYSAAGDRKQARITFDDGTKLMTDEVRERCVVQKNSIFYPRTQSTWEVLSADAFTKHGFRPYLIIFDELHVQPNRRLWDALRLGMPKRREPLLIAITTAGVYDEESLCWNQHEYALQTLADPAFDPAHYVLVYSMDEGDDPFAESTWRKVNPGWGITINPSMFAEQFERAKKNPAEQTTLFQLHLDCWADAVIENGVPMDKWREAGKLELLISKGDPCYMGLDLSSRGHDLTALELMFPHSDDTFSLLSYFWIPDVDLEERKRRDVFDYPRYVEEGHITTTRGEWVDHGPVREKIKELADYYDVREILFDPHNASQMLKWLQDDDGLPVVEHGQGAVHMSEPSKVFVGLVKAGRIRHGNNPVLNWCAGNIDFKVDVRSNWIPFKRKQRKRIDGAIAAIMCTRGAAITQTEETIPAMWRIG